MTKMTDTKSTNINLLMKELEGYTKKQVTSVLDLLADGNTVPFIARYRKEATGSLDEVQIREIEERYTYITNLEKRKADVLTSIEEQGKSTPELAKEIKEAVQMQRVEDLYRPYKQKRRTEATIAKEQGLEALSDWLLSLPEGSIEAEAENYINEEMDIHSAEEALAGAQEIIAE